jgi:hypothetical protein
MVFSFCGWWGCLPYMNNYTLVYAAVQVGETNLKTTTEKPPQLIPFPPHHQHITFRPIRTITLLLQLRAHPANPPHILRQNLGA